VAYKSKYYDPKQTAKDEAERKAKAKRRSTAGLSDKGKAIARNVKQNIRNYRQQYYDAEKLDMQTKIAQLREELRAMSKEQRKAMKETYKQKIADLRQQHKERKEKIKAWFEKLYLSELDKIKADPSLQKPKKTRKRKSSRRRSSRRRSSRRRSSGKGHRGRPKGAKDKKKRKRRDS